MEKEQEYQAKKGNDKTSESSIGNAKPNSEEPITSKAESEKTIDVESTPR